MWNSTVSNLTLMALGSSAPEILLSVRTPGPRSCNCSMMQDGVTIGKAVWQCLSEVIELLKNNMYSGDLGPSTIATALDT